MHQIFALLHEIVEGFLYFLSTNHPPRQHRIIVSMLVVACLGIAIFILSYLTHNLRKVDLLKVRRYNTLTCIKWTMGAVVLDFVLVVAQISNYNIITFLATAMIWDTLYRKIFNHTKEKEITQYETIQKR